jgi:hypothetical protein
MLHSEDGVKDMVPQGVLIDGRNEKGAWSNSEGCGAHGCLTPGGVRARL